MDILPNQILRHIQYDHRERVLSSKTVWICASCYTCSVRCPNNIDIAKIMDALRNLALRSGAKLGEKEIPMFHSVFLDTIKSKGRIHELSLLIQLKLKTKDFFKDAGLGWKMFRRGKIKLLPSRYRGGKEIQEIFNEFEKGARK
jgi:heterodisulfide reductase subunit C